jgi:hypothetical protein
MANPHTRGAHALFQSIEDDGTTWRFVINADDTWSITRNGRPVDVGPADRTGIDGGVREYLRLAAKVERGPAAQRQPELSVPRSAKHVEAGA